MYMSTQKIYYSKSYAQNPIKLSAPRIQVFPPFINAIWSNLIVNSPEGWIIWSVSPFLKQTIIKIIAMYLTDAKLIKKERSIDLN